MTPTVLEPAWLFRGIHAQQNPLAPDEVLIPYFDGQRYRLICLPMRHDPTERIRVGPSGLDIWDQYQRWFYTGHVHGTKRYVVAEPEVRVEGVLILPEWWSLPVVMCDRRSRPAVVEWLKQLNDTRSIFVRS